MKINYFNLNIFLFILEMSNLCEELGLKFNALEAKIEAKLRKVAEVYKDENELLEKKFDIENLLEKYSNELNVYRDGLLKQVAQNMVSEIKDVNEMQAEFDENISEQNLLEILKDTKKFKFNCSLIKSKKIVVELILSQIF